MDRFILNIIKYIIVMDLGTWLLWYYTLRGAILIGVSHETTKNTSYPLLQN